MKIKTKKDTVFLTPFTVKTLILKRILMYFVFLISLYFSFYIFENTKALIILVPLILSGHYIFWDILILLTKRDLKNNKK